MTTHYGFGTTLHAPYEEALEQVKAALKTEGFGILTEIDVRRTMREKLNIEMASYSILGACNPPLAHRALTQDVNIGLLLPCNVVVRAEGEHSRVEIADPEVMLDITGSAQLHEVAQDAKQRLLRVVDALSKQNQVPQR